MLGETQIAGGVRGGYLGNKIANSENCAVRKGVFNQSVDVNDDAKSEEFLRKCHKRRMYLQGRLARIFLRWNLGPTIKSLSVHDRNAGMSKCGRSRARKATGSCCRWDCRRDPGKERGRGNGRTVATALDARTSTLVSDRMTLSNGRNFTTVRRCRILVDRLLPPGEEPVVEVVEQRPQYVEQGNIFYARREAPVYQWHNRQNFDWRAAEHEREHSWQDGRWQEHEREHQREHEHEEIHHQENDE